MQRVSSQASISSSDSYHGYLASADLTRRLLHAAVLQPEGVGGFCHFKARLFCIGCYRFESSVSKRERLHIDTLDR
jgi:hypothetical protein